MYLAIIVLDIIILFLIINLLIYGVMLIKHKVYPTKPNSLGYPEDVLNRLYPYMNKTERTILLNEEWDQVFIYEPYVQHREKPKKTKYINIDEKGFRHIKNQYEFFDETKYNIFVFGGSTTFGYGVTDYETIPSRIQEKLNNVCVYNFGRGAYFSTTERILLESLIIDNKIPNMVIFIDGYNDYYFLEPQFTAQLESFMREENKYDAILRNVPMFKLWNYLFPKYALFFPNYPNKIFDEEILHKLTDRYFVNKRMIESVCEKFNITSYFVIQPVSLYNYNLSYHIVYNEVYDGDIELLFRRYKNIQLGYPILNEYYQKRKDENIIWLADIQENLNKNLCVDSIHYTSEFSDLIAEYIVDGIRNSTLINKDYENN